MKHKCKKCGSSENVNPYTKVCGECRWKKSEKNKKKRWKEMDEKLKNKKPNQYSFNNGGKMMIIIAISKKQIREHFGVSSNYVTNYCSKCGYMKNRKIDLDLTELAKSETKEKE